jgi:hypothetical protein
MKYTYSFYKEDQKCYIYFPAYIAQGGSKSDLLTVAGADKMLDKLSNGKEVTLNFTDEPIEGSDIKLKKLFGDHWGATYRTNKPCMVKLVWLCNVTKVVMGCHPNEIFVSIC